MVEVEVRDHHVPDVGGVVAERLDLPHGGLVQVGAAPTTRTNGGPRRLGSAMSPAPIPVSTRTSPSALSTSRQWATSRSGISRSGSDRGTHGGAAR